MKTFEQLLDYRVLLSMYRAQPVLSELFFTKTFFDGSAPKDIDSDTAELISVTATTQPGPGNTRGGAARRIAAKGGTKRYFNQFRYFTELELPADALRALREPESEGLMDKGRQVVELQQEEEKTRADLFKEVVVAQILTTGRVNLGASGEILVPSVDATTGVITDATGTLISADFGVADGHRGNLGGTISALWSTAGTKISTQLDTLRRQAGSIGAPRPKEIYVNAIKKSVLRANAEFDNWAKYNSTRVDAILQNDFIENLWGYNWHFIDGTWTDSTGTTRDLIPQTSVIITPQKGPWLRAMRGSELVPRTLSIAGSLSEALNNIEKVYGTFNYAKLYDNPVRLASFYGDNFGLNYADPNAVWMPTVFA